MFELCILKQDSTSAPQSLTSMSLSVNDLKDPVSQDTYSVYLALQTEIDYNAINMVYLSWSYLTALYNC